MRWSKDQSEKALVCSCDSVLDAIEGAKGSDETQHWYLSAMQEWIGRTDIHTEKDVLDSVSKPWKDGIAAVQRMQEELKNCDIPSPKTIKRKMRWNEDDGEVDASRLLAGEANFYLQSYKQSSTGASKIISILLHTTMSVQTYWKDALWKAAATVVLADKLEEAGYSCEVITWSLTRDLYEDNNFPWGFWTCKIKRSGDPVDLDTLTNALSPWFYRIVTHGGEHNNPWYDVSECHGYFVRGLTVPTGNLISYLDLEGSTVAAMPAVHSQEEAIQAAKDILEKIGNSN